MKKNSIFGIIDIFDDFDDIFKETDNLITTFYPNYDFMKPIYALKDIGDKYEVKVEYNDSRDELYVRTNKDRNKLYISVYEDWNKTNAYSSCRYYGRFSMTVPEDCDLDSIEKTVDKENKQMIITFNKVKKVEDKKEEKPLKILDKSNDVPNVEEEKTVDGNGVDYRALYDDLLEKYNKEVGDLKYKLDKYIDERDELKKKLDDIKKLFN